MNKGWMLEKIIKIVDYLEAEDTVHKARTGATTPAYITRTATELQELIQELPEQTEGP